MRLFVRPAHEDVRIDPVGALIFAAGFGGLLYPLIEGFGRAWSGFLVAYAPAAGKGLPRR